MKPDEPHPFAPRSKRAPGRHECAVCAQGADAPVHTIEMLRRMVRSEMAPVLCSTEGCLRKCYSGGKCRVHTGRAAIVSAQVTPELAAKVAAAKGEASTSEFIRRAIEAALEVDDVPT